MAPIYIKTTYECKHDFHGIIEKLNISYYNCTDGTDDALRYGMIKYNKKEETFIIIDRNRTKIYDSRYKNGVWSLNFYSCVSSNCLFYNVL